MRQIYNANQAEKSKHDDLTHGGSSLRLLSGADPEKEIVPRTIWRMCADLMHQLSSLPGKAQYMFRLTLLLRGRLFSMIHLPGSHVRGMAVAEVARSVTAADQGSDCLYHEACALLAEFARARSASRPDAPVIAERNGGIASALEVMDRERSAFAMELASLERRLHSCREAFNRCESCLRDKQRRQVLDALRTLETECSRLSDAERFLFLRRRRQIQTREADEDPEFTKALERSLYAASEGDEVASSVSHAVRAITMALQSHEAEKRCDRAREGIRPS